ncbi:MAG: thioredoxin family protein [Deltaproteobacteria bacterium]|nr:thioredoxin family protein [Deltaproteobacteria bacterium]
MPNRSHLKFMPWALIALVALLLPSVATAEDEADRYLLISMEGMDCVGCNKRLSNVFSSLEWLEDVHASFAVQGACGRLTGDVDEAALTASLGTEGPHKVVKTAVVAVCPDGLRGALPTPWDGKTEGRDVTTISHGEKVDITAHLAADKYTVVDFGASWCGPCHEAAETIATYLDAHADVAVRAIELDGETAQASYEQPVVAQHLAYVSGIPWLVVYSPAGKVISKTQSVDKTLASIDKHRAKMAKKK